MTLQDIAVHPQAQETTEDPREKPGLPQQTLPPCIQVAAGQSSQGSSVTSCVTRMPLGPKGTTLLQARVRDAEQEQRAHETATSGQPMEYRAPDRSKFQLMENQQERIMNFASPRDEDAGGEAPTNPVGNLQTYFDAAMARFLQDATARVQVHKCRDDIR